MWKSLVFMIIIYVNYIKLIYCIQFDIYCLHFQCTIHHIAWRKSLWIKSTINITFLTNNLIAFLSVLCLQFFLQDTKSSNGTFINNQRLSKGSEESPPKELFSGDIVQFGVDVLENARRGESSWREDLSINPHQLDNLVILQKNFNRRKK